MSYGVQGEPVTVSSTPAPPAPAQPEAPFVPPQPPPPPVEAAAPVAPESPEAPPVEPLTPDETLVAALADMERLRAVVGEAQRLVTMWEDRAARTLITGDSQRGQRDATLACSGDLRTVLGI